MALGKNLFRQLRRLAVSLVSAAPDTGDVHLHLDVRVGMRGEFPLTAESGLSHHLDQGLTAPNLGLIPIRIIDVTTH
jgi:hypothetical protein